MYFSLIAGFFKLDHTIHSAILFTVSLLGSNLPAVCNGDTGASNTVATLPTIQGLLASLVNPCGTTSIHKLLAHQAVLLISASLVAVPALPANQNHLLANQAHHCTTVSMSLATQNGSCSMLLPKLSIVQYLSFSILCHSLVVAKFRNDIILSNGLVIPLAIPVAPFVKLQGAFTTIVGNFSIHSPNHPNFSLRNLATFSCSITGIFIVKLFSSSNTLPTGFIHSPTHKLGACQASDHFTHPWIGACCHHKNLS